MTKITLETMAATPAETQQRRQRPKARSLLETSSSSSHHKSTHAKDEFTSVTVRKDEDDPQATKVGIKLKLEDDGRVRVSAIAKNGLFADSDVQVGDTLLSVNGKRLKPGQGAEVLMSVITKARATVTCVVKKNNVASKRPPKTKSLIRNNSPDASNDNNVTTEQRYRGMTRFKKDGSIDVSASARNDKTDTQELTATIVKDEQEDDVGMTFVVRDGALFIESVTELSHFQDTPLRVGDKVVSINDMSFAGYADANYALRLLQKARRNVTVTVERPKSKPRKRPTSNSVKHQASSVLSNNTTSTAVSSSESDEASEDSIGSFGDRVSDLRPSTDAPDTLQSVANSTTCIQRVSITAPKKFEKQNVGLVFKKGKRHLVVDQIHLKSIFQGTSLQVGDAVLSVNDVNFERKVSVKRAQQALVDAKESVVLVVEKRHTDFHLHSSFTMDGSQGLVW